MRRGVLNFRPFVTDIAVGTVLTTFSVEVAKFIIYTVEVLRSFLFMPNATKEQPSDMAKYQNGLTNIFVIVGGVFIMMAILELVRFLFSGSTKTYGSVQPTLGAAQTRKVELPELEKAKYEDDPVITVPNAEDGWPLYYRHESKEG